MGNIDFHLFIDNLKGFVKIEHIKTGSQDGMFFSDVLDIFPGAKFRFDLQIGKGSKTTITRRWKRWQNMVV
jgi:hypothetical protein